MTTRVKIVEHVAIILVTTRVNVFLDLWEKIVKVNFFHEVILDKLMKLHKSMSGLASLYTCFFDNLTGSADYIYVWRYLFQL